MKLEAKVCIVNDSQNGDSINHVIYNGSDILTGRSKKLLISFLNPRTELSTVNQLESHESLIKKN
jgi:hypothetical protein